MHVCHNRVSLPFPAQKRKNQHHYSVAAHIQPTHQTSSHRCHTTDHGTPDTTQWSSREWLPVRLYITGAYADHYPRGPSLLYLFARMEKYHYFTFYTDNFGTISLCHQHTSNPCIPEKTTLEPPKPGPCSYKLILLQHKNLQGALSHPKVVKQYLQTRKSSRPLQLIRPTCSACEHVSRFGVIPKLNQPSKWRFTIDLSYPKSRSFNDGISKPLCKLYCITIDNAISKIV